MMNEFIHYIKAPMDHPYTKKCLEYVKKREQALDLGAAYAEKWGIPKNEFAVLNDSFYILDTPANQEKFAGQLKKSDDGKYCAFKKNSKIGKGWETPFPDNRQPNIGWEMYKSIGLIGGRYGILQFVSVDGLYARVKLAAKADIPAGFTEIKGSDFMLIVEAIDSHNREFIHI